MVGLQRKALRGRRNRLKGASFNQTSTHTPHDYYAYDKRESRSAEHQSHADKNGIRQQPHRSPQYHRRNWLPKKKAIKAILPRKTPNGIWCRRRAMAADSQARLRASRAGSWCRVMRRRVRLNQTTITVESPNNDPAIEAVNNVKIVS